jgi:hypothetical protein
MVVVRWCRPHDGEAPEAVITLELGGRRIQSAPLQGLPESELVPSTKRRVRRVVGADVVAVPPAHCTVPRVKLVSHLDRLRDPDVGGKDRIQCAPQALHVPSIRNPNSHRLASRVYAGVGSTGAQRRDSGSTQPLERVFQDTLNRPLLRLPLPSAETRPVVVQHELHGALGHCRKATRARCAVNQRTR